MDLITKENYCLLTIEELINTLQDEINYAIKTNTTSRVLKKSGILDGWNLRFELLKKKLSENK